ncbi:MAG: alpha/beta fold hydrolase, partial [Candidatus Omnitrophota bacterium]
SFWYAFLYTLLVLGFGIPAYRRWAKKDRYQQWRYISLFFFQAVFFFLIPEVIARLILKWPDYGKTYEFIYAWPLSWNVFFDHPPGFYIIWGLLLTFVVIPIFVRWHGVRYCSWACGCGAIAETLGDRWRHLAPKGEKAAKWEVMGTVILVLAVVIALAVLLNLPSFPILRNWYSWVVDFLLVGLIPMALYPFLGGKIWCRYWCPLARGMHILSKWYGTLKISANNKCLQCGTCNKYCQVGVDVMRYAKEGGSFSNKDTSCIACGICITACPQKVLKFGNWPNFIPTQHILVKGIKTRYADLGSGEKVLFLHGFPENLQTWRFYAPIFAEKFRFLACDLKGFGYSEKPQGDYSPWGMADFVSDFMDSLKIEKVYLVGTDIGFTIACALALRYPEKIKKLILMAGAVSQEGIVAPEIKLLNVKPLGEIILRFLGPLAVQMGLKKGFYSRDLISKEIFAEYYSPYKEQLARRRILELIRSFNEAGFQLSEEIEKINLPTLILWAQEEHFFSLISAQSLQKKIKNSRLEIIP